MPISLEEIQSVYSTAPADWTIDLMLINKKIKKREVTILWILPFQLITDWKKSRKQKDRQILGFGQKKEKKMNIRVTVIPIVIDAFGRVAKGLEKRLEELEI